jgi:hypothetical protein
MSDDEMDFGESMFWAFELQPGKTYSQTPPMDLRVTQAALAGSATDKGRVVVSVIIDGGEYTLGSLRLGQCEQFPLDLFFEEGQEVTFKVEGKNSVHLLGYYVEEGPEQFDYDTVNNGIFDEEEGFSEDSDEEEEEGMDWEDIIKRAKGNRVEILEEKQHGDLKPASEKEKEVSDKKKKNKKRKELEEQSPAKDEGTKKSKKGGENGKPQTPAAKEKPQTPGKEKSQTPSTKEKPQTPTKEPQTPGKKRTKCKEGISDSKQKNRFD